MNAITAEDIAARAYDLLEPGRTYSADDLAALSDQAEAELKAEQAPAYPTSVTVHEGHTVRVMAQTASRDYTATTVPGTYPIRYTTVNGHPVKEGDRPYYAVMEFDIDSPERRESSVEFGGRTLATHLVPAARSKHFFRLYGYQVEDAKFADANLTFHFEEAR